MDGLPTKMVGMAASTLKALTARGAGALFPASSLAVSFKIWIVISPLPVKLERVTVRVTVPLVPVPENAPTLPISPYGASKLMTEQMLKDSAIAYGLQYIALRYFNVAGADPKGRIGQSTPRATHLIKVACQAALGQRERLEVFGTDYDTPDGTCLRDYIHVSDLIAAHVDALTYLRTGGNSGIFNCGYGKGYSVLEVIKAVERVNGAALSVTYGPRRAGDPAAIVAGAARVREVLGWQPQYENLDFIVETALNWERKLEQRNTTG